MTAGKDGFSVKSADNAFWLRFGGLVQADYRDYFDSNVNPPANDGFLMRRVRPVFEGRFYEKFAFLIRAELAGTVQLLDAYIDANLWPELRLRAGKFKAPSGWSVCRTQHGCSSPSVRSQPTSCPIATSARNCLATSSTER